MQAFDYEALDASGKAKSGVIAADNAREARRRLQSSELFATSLIPSQQKKQTSEGLFLGRDKIASKDLSLIIRQLATMLGAGSPIEEALAAIASNTEKAVIRKVLTRVRMGVMEGMRLSQAMQQEPDAFDALFCFMVAAGETSGDLSGVLMRVADHREKADETRGKIQAALVYPLVLSIVALGVISALMVFVVPQVVAQFESYSTQLPFLTRMVVGASAFMVSYGVFLLAAIVAVIVGFSALMRRSVFKYGVHRFLLSLPILGRLMRAVNTARFARALGTLVRGGTPVLEALAAARETVQNKVMQRALDTAITQVREGTAIHAALKQAGQFPPMLVYMVAAGERSGLLADMLDRVADYTEREFDDFSKKALSLLEPMIVLLMGGVVGLIVMSIMLPILQLNSLILK